MNVYVFCISQNSSIEAKKYCNFQIETCCYSYIHLCSDMHKILLRNNSFAEKEK